MASARAAAPTPSAARKAAERAAAVLYGAILSSLNPGSVDRPRACPWPRAPPCGQGCNVRPLVASGFVGWAARGHRAPPSGRREWRALARLLNPSRQVALRPRGQRALSGEPPLRAGRALSRLVQPRLGDQGKEAEIDIHRLERAGAGVDRFDVAPGDVVQERADRGGRRRGFEREAQPLGGGEASGDEPDRGALDIALAAGDLAGETQTRRGPEAKTPVEQPGRIEIGVAVDAAEPGELRPLEPGNHAEDAPLLAVFELGLEADHVEQAAES